tara:strand:+ start:611 stop:850 length:240 start_codon:yes stop_codon:yes gene_type:complete
MEIIREFWHQIIFIGLILVLFTRLREQTTELRKDVDEILKRDTYVRGVKMEAEMATMNKQVSALWAFVNKLRDRFNGTK